MEKFPELEANQVGLMRCQFSTGHVLDENFELAVNNKQKVYTILGSKENAFEKAKEIILQRNDVECVIYDANHKVLSYLNIDNIKL